MESFIGNHVCGLHYYISSTLERVYLPQVQLKSHTTINPVCFTTKLTQTFQNSSSTLLSKVRYTFPLYDGVAVNGYTISYGSKLLKGTVKQKDVAKKTYQVAVERGETAGLLEALPAGVFGVTLGNVPAKTDIVVEITYCGELKHDAAIDGLRYNLPTSIAPRYGSYPGKVLNSNTVAKGGINITVDLDMASSAIRKVQSPSHPIAISMGTTSTNESGNQAPFNSSQASATLTLGSAELADDFVLQLLIDDISKPQAILETHPTLPNQRALMATLVPRFTLEPMYPEIVFVADQSGSMGGSKNDALVSALKVFLKSLPLGVRFNICAFGNDFKLLWPKSQAYNEDNLNLAISFVDSFQANYGGTEILKPITAVFEKRLTDLPLEVMLLTDGEIWGEDAVFNYINEQIQDKGVDARVFALGIGGDVSHTLVEGVARAGRGFAQFVTQNEETDQKVIRMLKGALYAHTKDYELEVHYDEKKEDAMGDDDDFEIIEKVNDYLKIADEAVDPVQQTKPADAKATSFFDESADVDKANHTNGQNLDRYAHLPVIETPNIVQAPNAIPPLFPFNRSTIYLLLGPESVQKNVSSVTLRAMSAQGPLELSIPVHNSVTPAITTIHQLAARKAMQDLEEGRGWLQSAHIKDGSSVKAKHESRFDEIVEHECVRLGERFQVAGKWTSFVAVEDKGGKQKNENISKAAGIYATWPDSTSDGSSVGQQKVGTDSPVDNTFDSNTTTMTLDFDAQSPHLDSFDWDNFDNSEIATADFDADEDIEFEVSDKRLDFSHGLYVSMARGLSRAALKPDFCKRDRNLDPEMLTDSRGGAKRKRVVNRASAFPQLQDFGISGKLFGSSQTLSTPKQLDDELTFEAAPSFGSPSGFAATHSTGGGSSLLGVGGGSDSDFLARMSAPSSSPRPAARVSTGGMAPRMQLASKAARKSAPGSAPLADSGPDTGAMYTLINLQTFSGAWAWSDELLSELGVTAADVDANKLGGSPDVCATALAVAFFEAKMASQRAVWEMIVAKARLWLAQQMGVDEKGVDGVVSKAAAYL